MNIGTAAQQRQTGLHVFQLVFEQLQLQLIARVASFLFERTIHRTAAGPARTNERSIDVEENNRHSVTDRMARTADDAA